MHDAAIEWLAGLFPVVSTSRGRVALMFTDIEGFTTCAATHGNRAALGSSGVTTGPRSPRSAPTGVVS